MNRTAITVSLVPEARGGPFVFWDLEDGCRKAKALGYDAIELFAPSAEAVTAAAPALEKHGLALAAAGTGAGWVLHKLTLTSPDAEVRARAKAFIRGFIDAAGRLGAPAILGSMEGRWGGSVDRPQAQRMIADALADFGPAAEAHGVPFLLEPLNRYEGNVVNTLEEAAALAPPNVGILADLFHMNIEERSPSAALRSAARHVRHVQLADSNRHPAGLGHTDWTAVASALRDIGYSGYLSAEALPVPDPESAARIAMESIRRYFRWGDRCCSTS
jgi:sugar phosphate isomerase/epimerase